MTKVGRTLATGAATIGLALAATGCSSNVIGDDVPQPGLAAQVEDTKISLDDLDEATDGVCTLQAADESVPGTSREYAQARILQAWIGALVDAAYAEDKGLDVHPADPGLELAPGWDDVDEDDLDALQSYVDASVYSSAVRQEAQAQGEDEAPDPADYDITLNPRFYFDLDGEALSGAGAQLSVLVSDEDGSDLVAPSAEELQALPDDEICGHRPDPAAAPPVPVG